MPTGVYLHKKHSEETRKKISEKNKGKYISEETKRKISKAMKGKMPKFIPNNLGKHWKLSEEAKKHINEAKMRRPGGMLGKHHSEETRGKISEANKNPSLEIRQKMSKARKGLKNWNWKGGVTSQNHLIRYGFDAQRWRKAVFERDNYTCQICHQRGKKLNAHHIEEFSKYPEKRFDVSNGITLCIDCHKLVHKSAFIFLGIYTAIANLTVKILDLEKEIKELEENQKKTGMYEVYTNSKIKESFNKKEEK